MLHENPVLEIEESYHQKEEDETKLKLVEKFNQTKAMVKEIQELTGQYKKSGDQALIDKIEEISEKIGQL